jgi:hypothetical protein
MDLVRQGMDLFGKRKKTMNVIDRVKTGGVVGTLKGEYKPEDGTPVLEAAEVRKRLLALRGMSIPMEVVETEGKEPGELVARWRIRDAKWWSAFKHVGTEAVTDIHLVLDESEHLVRGLDKVHTVKWTGNVPTLDKNSNIERDPSAWWNAEDPLNPGNNRRWNFDGAEVKDIIGTVITDAGWTLKQVWRKKTLLEG